MSSSTSTQIRSTRFLSARFSSTCNGHANYIRELVWQNGDAIAEGHHFARIGSDALAGNDNPDKIEWISRGHRDDFAGWQLIAHGAERFHGPRQSELLSQEIADEAAAANFATIFQSAKSDEQLAPLGENGFAREKLAKDDAIAAEQHPANGFEGAVAVGVLVRIEQRPAACAVARARSAPAALAGAPLGIDERAEVIKTVRG